MWFQTADNGDEYFRWSHVSGTDVEYMTLKSDGLRVKGNMVLHAGNYTSYCATANHTHNGTYLPLTGGTLSKNDRDTLILKCSSETQIPYITFYDSSQDHYCYVGGYRDSSKYFAWFGCGSSRLFLDDTANSLRVGTDSVNYKVWHEANDGSGSGLDADMLDGYHASSFLTSLDNSSNGNLLKKGGLHNLNNSSFSYDYETDVYTLVSTVGKGGYYGSGVEIRSSGDYMVRIPYGCHYRFICEVYVPSEHGICLDQNNSAVGADVWSGNDNDVQRYVNIPTIPANTWTTVYWGGANLHSSNTSKVDIFLYDEFGLNTVDDSEPVTWYIRRPRVVIGRNSTWWTPCDRDNVHLYGDQTIGGVKTFSSNIYAPVIYQNGTQVSVEGHSHTLSSLGAASSSHNHDGTYLKTIGGTLTGHLKISGTSNLASSWDPGIIAGSDGHDKVVLSYLASSTNGAVIGGHNSGLSEWAPLNIAGTALIFRYQETEKMRMDSSGNLGIGTSSPSYKLDVNGSLNATTIYQNGTQVSVNGHTHSYLPLSGGTLTGSVTFSGNDSIYWSRNTDYARISFKNTGDGDGDSYMWFQTADNGDEYFRWSHDSGGDVEWMTLKSSGLRVKGNLVLHAGNYTDYTVTKTGSGASGTWEISVTGSSSSSSRLNTWAWITGSEGNSAGHWNKFATLQFNDSAWQYFDEFLFFGGIENSNASPNGILRITGRSSNTSTSVANFTMYWISLGNSWYKDKIRAYRIGNDNIYDLYISNQGTYVTTIVYRFSAAPNRLNFLSSSWISESSLPSSSPSYTSYLSSYSSSADSVPGLSDSEIDSLII